MKIILAFLVVIIIGVLVGLWLTGLDVNCIKAAEHFVGSDYKAQYDFIEGCMVQVDGFWVTLEVAILEGRK